MSKKPIETQYSENDVTDEVWVLKDGELVKVEATNEAKRMLEGWWKPEFLQEVFDKEKAFRLWTAFSVVWTKDENGLVPMAGFMGVCE